MRNYHTLDKSDQLWKVTDLKLLDPLLGQNWGEEALDCRYFANNK